jgi:hypothetical protein
LFILGVKQPQHTQPRQGYQKVNYLLYYT